MKIPSVIPCVKEKCLKYPICQNRQEIKCNSLNRYFKLIEVDREPWGDIQEHLPWVTFIQSE